MTANTLIRPRSLRARWGFFRRGIILLIGLAVFIHLDARLAIAQESLPDATQPATEKPVKTAETGTGSWRLPLATNVVSYWFGPNYHTVYVTVPNTLKGATIQRNTAEYTHSSFWKLGSNFADINIHKSNIAEPTDGNTGATEVYGTFREKIGLNELTGTKAFHLGPIRNLAIEVGANLETKNSVYSPAERSIYVGPNIQFNIPRGYFNIGIHARKEWNKQEITNKAERYTPDFNIEPTWMFPFALGKAHLTYTGFADYNTQKGTDSFGNATVYEFIIRNYLATDIGACLFHRPERLDLNAGFWYWHNEYGKPSSDPGGEQMTPMFGLAFHLGGRGTSPRK